MLSACLDEDFCHQGDQAAWVPLKSGSYFINSWDSCDATGASQNYTTTSIKTKMFLPPILRNTQIYAKYQKEKCLRLLTVH